MFCVLFEAYLRFIFLVDIFPVVNVMTCHASLWTLNKIHLMVSDSEFSCTVFSKITKRVEVTCSHCHKMIKM